MCIDRFDIAENILLQNYIFYQQFKAINLIFNYQELRGGILEAIYEELQFYWIQIRDNFKRISRKSQ